MQPEISDRIAAAIRERGEPLSAEEIAREYLKLMQVGPAAGKLVRAMLARDGRFEEATPGRWGLARSGPALAPPVVLWVCEVPAGTQATPWLWRVWSSVWGTEEPARAHQGPRRTEDLEEILAQISANPVAATKPGLLRRWLGTQERLHACPEFDPVIIDLAAWERLLPREAERSEAAGDRARSVHPRARRGGRPRPAADPDDGPTAGDATATLAALLEEVAAAARARGLRTWRDVALVPEVAREAGHEVVWGADWAFTPEEVAALPEEPGIYRFLDREGRLLYVGKAKNLRSRVGSYFRPVATGSSRRATFLSELHRLETESTGTELEALLLEAEQIREGKPSWNVQVNVSVEEVGFALSEQDLVLLLPRPDGALSLLALGGARVARARIDGACDLDALREALREYYVEGTAAGGLEEIGSPERALVRRWLRWAPEGHVVLRLSDFATFAGLAEAIETVLRGETNAAHPEGASSAGAARGTGLVVREGPGS